MGLRQASMVNALTPVQYDIIYNCTSLGLASMMASTVFFFLRLQRFSERYKAALCFTGLVTFIAAYHYFRIFNSFNAAYTPCEVMDGVVNPHKCDADTFGYSPTGHAFNDAYRYVDWFLTVPLLLIEIVLVMKLSEAETFSQSLKLGFFSALMILNGYPGEVSSSAGTRWVFWFLSMIPFCYIVYTLFVGLKASQEAQPEACKEQVKWACWATVISSCTALVWPRARWSLTRMLAMARLSQTPPARPECNSVIISPFHVHLPARVWLACELAQACNIPAENIALQLRNVHYTLCALSCA